MGSGRKKLPDEDTRGKEWVAALEKLGGDQ